MALLTILHHPDPRLRQVAQPVTAFDDGLQRLIDDLFETMYDAPGVGLAATQVGVAQRVAVMDCGQDEGRQERIVMVNPEITDLQDPRPVDEACLSVPGVGEAVRRYHRARVRALDRDGKPFELEGEGLLAQCIQHECDHLRGKLYLDHLSSLKRDRLLRRMRETQATGSAAD